MFTLYTDTPELFHDICDEIRLFVPEKQIRQTADPNETDAGKLLRHFFWLEAGRWHTRVEYYIGGKLEACKESTPAFTDEQTGMQVDITANTLLAKKMKKHHVKLMVYELLQEYYQKHMPWGSLTGIRPTKLLRELVEKKGGKAAQELFSKVYHVSDQKRKLAQKIVAVQTPFLENIRGNALDIYIGIPFCVSRCKYCSFISRDIKQSEQLKGRYLECLFHEMEQMRDTLAKYSIRTVYVGGGTPTALDAHELERLLSKIDEIFPQRGEFTVEAGRPDTISLEKLHILKAHGARRISLNPQTTKSETLKLIGRNHTPEDFFRAFDCVREMGFDCVNTDLILGLPKENLKDLKKTLEDVMLFHPENITVHTLALKNSSEFMLERQKDLPDAQTMEAMVSFAQEFLFAQGYEPYYLYRQKYMNGNLENVGFAKPGKECVYNIDIMEETVSNLAFGAGAISKRLFPDENRIERAPNVKDLKHYTERIDEMVERKKRLF